MVGAEDPLHDALATDGPSSFGNRGAEANYLLRGEREIRLLFHAPASRCENAIKNCSHPHREAESRADKVVTHTIEVKGTAAGGRGWQAEAWSVGSL